MTRTKLHSVRRNVKMKHHEWQFPLLDLLVHEFCLPLLAYISITPSNAGNNTISSNGKDTSYTLHDGISTHICSCARRTYSDFFVYTQAFARSTHSLTYDTQICTHTHTWLTQSYVRTYKYVTHSYHRLAWSAWSEAQASDSRISYSSLCDAH